MQRGFGYNLILSIIFLIAFIVSVGFFFTSGNKTNKSDQQPIIISNQELEDQLTTKALDYLKTKPNIDGKPWDDYFNQSYLATTSRKVLTVDWLITQEVSLFNEEGIYVISWTGLPGCKQDKSQKGGADYGPNYFDETGNRCYLLWLVNVYYDQHLQPTRVNVSEVGGIV